jgi:hypothetical protein
MTFPIATKLAALLDALTQADIEALPPARRERLGQLLKHWGARCDPPKDERKAGAISDPRRGERGE